MTLTARPPDTPACLGRWELFDSREPADHHEAKAMCAGCPVRDWCAAQLRKAQQSANRSTSYPDAGPQGTWAGQLVGGAHRPRPAVTWTEEEARAAHAAYVRGGQADSWAREGHSVYERRRVESLLPRARVKRLSQTSVTIGAAPRVREHMEGLTTPRTLHGTED